MDTRPYRPSNGTEGMGFMERWCDQCRRDDAFQRGEGDICPIAAATMAYLLGHPDYPDEWVTDAQLGPRCTAFEPMGDISFLPDSRQTDLFGGPVT